MVSFFASAETLTVLVADAARRENRTKSLRDDDDDVDLDDVDAFVEDALCKGLHDDKAWWCEAEESVDGIFFFFFFRGALIRSSKSSFCRVLRSRGGGGGAFGVMAFCLSNET